jgi:2'-5' RNA ligase
LKFRGFISADISPNDSLTALLDLLMRAPCDLKVVRAANLHVTLKFLGETEESLVGEIIERMRTSSEGVRPFRLRLQGMGAFPSMSSIRVVWVGMEDGRPMADLAARVDAAFLDIGFERDRKGFKPHLTVARARSGKGIEAIQDLIAANATTDFGEYAIDRITLKKSVLTPQGPQYSSIEEVPLLDG